MVLAFFPGPLAKRSNIKEGLLSSSWIWWPSYEKIVSGLVCRRELWAGYDARVLSILPSKCTMLEPGEDQIRFLLIDESGCRTRCRALLCLEAVRWPRLEKNVSILCSLESSRSMVPGSACRSCALARS